MKSAAGYAIREALASVRRDWRSAVLALLVIGAAVFVTGALLVALRAADRVLERLTEGADVSVFLALDATPDTRSAVENVLTSSPVVARARFVAPDEAAARLQAAYPDLAPLLAEGFALPASFDVTLQDARRGPDHVEPLFVALRSIQGVDQVRYDRALIERANALTRVVRTAGGLLAAMLAIAGAVATFSVIRLAYVARRDEVAILYLVGAPLAAIRGPFLVEGALQGGAGALLGVAALTGLLAGVGTRIAEAIGSGIASPASAVALPAATGVALVLAAAALGALAAALAWRSASRTYAD